MEFKISILVYGGGEFKTFTAVNSRSIMNIEIDRRYLRWKMRPHAPQPAREWAKEIPGVTLRTNISCCFNHQRFFEVVNFVATTRLTG